MESSANTRVTAIWKAGFVIFVVSILCGYAPHLLVSEPSLWKRLKIVIQRCRIRYATCPVLHISSAGIMRRIYLSRNSKSICAQLRKYSV